MRPALLALALAALPLAGPAAAEPYQKIGQWDVAYFPAAKGCGAVGQYDNGAVFLIGLDTTSGKVALEVGLLSREWSSILPGNQYDVTVTFGRKGPWYLTMIGAQSEDLYGLNAVWDGESDSAGRFVEEFMASMNMKWVYQGTMLGDLSLKDSRRAFNAVIECTEIYLGAGDAGSDPFATGGDPFAGSGADPFAAPSDDPFQ